MHTLPILKSNDTVKIIAPASRCSDEHLKNLHELLTSWQLNCLIDDDIFGADLLCANTDEIRFKSLKNSLLDSDVKAIICARGGYGSMRLISELMKVTPVITPKLFVGMSDITALNLYLQQHWRWPTIHGALAIDKFSPESIAAAKSILFGDVATVEFSGVPLNAAAEKNALIKASVTGGNLCLVQNSIGTVWQLDGCNKIILLEEVGERGYRVDRMLEHLQQSGVLRDAAAILFGDFIKGDEPDGTSLIPAVLERFAAQCAIPVVQIKGVGHGYTNFPMPLGTQAQLNLGKHIQLVCSVRNN